MIGCGTIAGAPPSCRKDTNLQPCALFSQMRQLTEDIWGFLSSYFS